MKAAGPNPSDPGTTDAKRGKSMAAATVSVFRRSPLGHGRRFVSPQSDATGPAEGVGPVSDTAVDRRLMTPEGFFAQAVRAPPGAAARRAAARRSCAQPGLRHRRAQLSRRRRAHSAGYPPIGGQCPSHPAHAASRRSCRADRLSRRQGRAGRCRAGRGGAARGARGNRPRPRRRRGGRLSRPLPDRHRIPASLR